MKQLSTLLLAAMLFAVPATMAAEMMAENSGYAMAAKTTKRQQEALRGRVIDAKGNPVGYATIVAMVGDEQVGGTTSDEQGNFSLTLPAGEYKIIIEVFFCSKAGWGTGVLNRASINASWFSLVLRV